MPEAARANIDIGGPCMIRAAAKNFLRVAAVTDPADYVPILEELRGTRGILSLRAGSSWPGRPSPTPPPMTPPSQLLGRQAESARSCYKIIIMPFENVEHSTSNIQL